MLRKNNRRNYMRTEAPKKLQKKNMSEEMLRKKYPEKNDMKTDAPNNNRKKKR